MKKKELKKEVEFGIENLDKIFNRILHFEKLVLDDRVKVSAFAYECLGYYNAIEHLIIRILKYSRVEIPSGSFSHKKILMSFENKLHNRKIPVNEELIKLIENLMAFRHVATKIYGFLLDWKKLEFIIEDIKKCHNQVKALFFGIIDQV